MKTEQISIFVENRSGKLTEIIHLLAINNINIRALSLADTSDFGILRMILSQPQKAIEVLNEHGFTLGKTSVVAVELADKPGSLDAILFLISSASINIEYMYACARLNQHNAIMIFRFDKNDEAIELLEASGYNIISEQKLCELT